MDYLIFFDESNKLDHTKKYSYYGAYGGNEQAIESNVRSVREILRLHRKKSEFHFTEYKNDRDIESNLHLLHHIINSDIHLNLFIVDNQAALQMAQQRNLTTTDLRSLFYVKIPERLFYGLTRRDDFHYGSVKIFVDHSDEYGALRLYSKLRHQMNAHSLYRGMSYQVTSVRSKKSHESIPLQIIDMFMGIVVFLIEKSYLETEDDKPVIKSDLIYRFLMENENIRRFQQQIKLFQWDGEKEGSIKKVNLSEYLSEFMVHKTKYDVAEMNKLNGIMLRNPDFRGKELRKAMEYSNNQLRMLLGYKDEIMGIGRNHFVMSRYYALFSEEDY